MQYETVITTMIYTHVLNRGGKGVVSPADIVAESPLPYASLTSPADVVLNESDHHGDRPD